MKNKSSFGNEKTTQKNADEAGEPVEKDRRDAPAFYQFLDIVLLLFENLLAYRVVFSFLGEDSRGFLYYFTEPVLFIFKSFEKALIFYSDSSRLELIPILLVFVLVILHGYLDKKYKVIKEV